MKLYDQYVKKLSTFKTIDIAWFTSFNLSIFFVEQYILPPLLKLDPPKDIRDVARLQDALMSLEGTIDLRFFADYSMIDYSEDKKTSINIHQVDNKLFDFHFRGGVFHPKVNLIVGDDQNGRKQAVLMTGSANMTLAGWGRNQEAVFIQEIKSRTNLEKILSFFTVLFESVDLSLPSNSIDLLKFQTTEEDWQFFHSFNGKDFLTTLFKDSPKELSVFSPYFSQSITKLCTDIKGKGNIDTFNIFPGLDRGKIRLSSNLFSSLQKKHPNIHLYCSKENNFSEFIQHRKVWITNTQSAIGSWNMTEAGMGLSSGQNNVEAGCFIKNTLSFNKSKFKEIRDDSLFISEDELSDDLIQSKDIRRAYINLKVRFDWSTERYTINGNIPSGAKYSIKIPGVTKIQTIIPLTDNMISIEIKSELVRQKRYILYKNKKEHQIGLVLEENIRLSPLYEYETLDDLLLSFAIDNKRSDRQRSILERTEEIANLKRIEEGIYSESITIEMTYFTMYRAINGLKKLLEELIEYKEIDEFGKYISSYPGNLQEFSEKLNSLADGKIEKNLSKVYVWSLFMEYDLFLKEIEYHLFDKHHKKLIKVLIGESQKRVKKFQKDYLKDQPMKEISRFYKKVGDLHV